VIGQIAIGLFGSASITMTNSTNKVKRRLGAIVDAAAQPLFGFYTTLMNGRRGAFIACFFYTYGWGRSLRDYWIKK